MPMEDIKTVYQQRHNLPSTYAPAAAHLHGLHRISLVKNPSWVPTPHNCLGGLFKKCEYCRERVMLWIISVLMLCFTVDITPTLPCPFTFLHDHFVDPIQDGIRRFVPGTHNRAGGRLLFMDGTSDRKGQVDAQNIQDDSEYLAQVGIGTPVQAMVSGRNKNSPSACVLTSLRT